MSKKLIVFLSLVLVNTANSKIIEIDKGAVAELEVKSLSNTKTAKDNGENWSSETVPSLYLNLDFNLSISKHKFKGSWFFRHISTSAFHDNHLVALTNFYPNKIIARDTFKMHYQQKNKNSLTDSVLGQFYYEIEKKDIKYKIGRIYINYGEGTIANPINPFNISGLRSNYLKFHQASDGVNVQIQKSTKFSLNLYLLHDKSYHGYDNEHSTNTIFVKGDWQYKPDTNIIYVLGEDQLRHKFGLQVKKSFPEGIFYLQGVQHSQKIKENTPAQNATMNTLIGLEFDYKKHFTTKIELAKIQKSNSLNETLKLNNSLIYMEKPLAIINEYRINKKSHIRASLIQDQADGLSFTKLEYNRFAKENLEIYLNYLSPFAKSKADEGLDLVQNALSQEIVLGLRFFK